MLLIIISRLAEAKPFIARFALKRDLTETVFPIYGNNSHIDNILLCVAGEGPVNAAAAVGYLFGRIQISQSDNCWLLHTGLCDQEQDGPASGALLYPHTIADASEGRLWYPDLLYRHPFCEGSLTNDKVAGAVFRIAMKWLPLHRIIIIKAVAEHDGESEINGLMQNAAVQILPWLQDIIETVAEMDAARRVTLNETDRQAVESTVLHLKLTHAMRMALEKDVIAYKSRGGDIVTLLSPFAAHVCETKQEGKIAFARLRQEILE